MGIPAELSHVDSDFEVYMNEIFTEATKHEWLEGHPAARKKLYQIQRRSLDTPAVPSPTRILALEGMDAKARKRNRRAMKLLEEDCVSNNVRQESTATEHASNHKEGLGMDRQSIPTQVGWSRRSFLVPKMKQVRFELDPIEACQLGQEDEKELHKQAPEKKEHSTDGKTQHMGSSLGTMRSQLRNAEEIAFGKQSLQYPTER